MLKVIRVDCDLLRNDHPSTSLPQNLHIPWCLTSDGHFFYLYTAPLPTLLSTICFAPSLCPPFPPSPGRIWAKCLMVCNKWLRVCYHLVLHTSTDAWLTFPDLLLFPTAVPTFQRSSSFKGVLKTALSPLTCYKPVDVKCWPIYD